MVKRQSPRIDPQKLPGMFQSLSEFAVQGGFGRGYPGETPWKEFEQAPQKTEFESFLELNGSTATTTANGSTIEKALDAGANPEVAAFLSLKEGVEEEVEEVSKKLVVIERTSPAKTQALAVEFLKANPDYLSGTQDRRETYSPLLYSALKRTLDREGVDEAKFWDAVERLKTNSMDQGISARFAPLVGEAWEPSPQPANGDAEETILGAAYDTVDDVREAFFAGDFVDEALHTGDFNRQNEAQGLVTLTDVMGREDVGGEDVSKPARDLMNSWMVIANEYPDLSRYTYDYHKGKFGILGDARPPHVDFPSVIPGQVVEPGGVPKIDPNVVTQRFLESFIDPESSPYGAELYPRKMWNITAYKQMGPKSLTPGRRSQLEARYEPTLGAYVLERLMPEEPNSEAVPWYQYLDEGYTKSSKEFYDKDKMNQGWDLFVRMSKNLGRFESDWDARGEIEASEDHAYALARIPALQRAAVQHRMGITGYGSGYGMKKSQFDRMYRQFEVADASQTPAERVGFSYWVTENYPSLFASRTAPKATPSFQPGDLVFP